jgi:hypothetical protein
MKRRFWLVVQVKIFLSFYSYFFLRFAEIASLNQLMTKKFFLIGFHNFLKLWKTYEKT